MQPQTEITQVIFRKYKEGDVIALFPYIIETHEGSVSCYQHVGQHGSADYDGVIKSTVPATEEEYSDLKEELESYPCPYNFEVIKKRSYNRYRKAWMKIYRPSL